MIPARCAAEEVCCLLVWIGEELVELFAVFAVGLAGDGFSCPVFEYGWWLLDVSLDVGAHDVLKETLES